MRAPQLHRQVYVLYPMQSIAITPDPADSRFSTGRPGVVGHHPLGSEYARRLLHQRALPIGDLVRMNLVKLRQFD